jgi:hypothetical protein
MIGRDHEWLVFCRKLERELASALEYGHRHRLEAALAEKLNDNAAMTAGKGPPR